MRQQLLLVVTSIALVGCDSCEPDVPIEPEGCIATRYDDFSFRYEPVAGSTECDDPDQEPNEDLSQAITGPVYECQDISKSGHIKDVADVDVYRTGRCDRGRLASAIDKEINVYASFETDEFLRFCIFPLCHDGATNLQGCSGNDDSRDVNGVSVATVWATRLESGFHGCCRAGTGTLQADFVCPYASRAVDTYFWIDSGADTAVCTPYDFTFTVD